MIVKFFVFFCFSSQDVCGYCFSTRVRPLGISLLSIMVFFLVHGLGSGISGVWSM